SRKISLEAEELVIGSGDAVLETTVLEPAQLWGAHDHTNLPALCREGLAGGITLIGSGDNLMATTHVRNLSNAAYLAATSEAARGGIYLICDAELTLQRSFYTELAKALELPRPKTRQPYPLALALAHLRQLRSKPGLASVEVRRRGTSSSFIWSKAKEELGY